MKLPSGEMTDGVVKVAQNRPASFLGQAAFEAPGGFMPIGVTWSGDANWKKLVARLAAWMPFCSDVFCISFAGVR